MIRNHVVFLLLCIIASFASASEKADIQLHDGENEVLVRICNNSKMNYDGLHIIFQNEQLPEGISIANNNAVTVGSQQESTNRLLLLITVNNQAQNGPVSIPFTLMDDQIHQWEYSLNAEITRDIPEQFELKTNYPNPFNPDTKIEYSLTDSEDVDVTLIIFNTLGKTLCTLVSEKQSAGYYTAIWDGKDSKGDQLPSGIYFYRLVAGSHTQTHKMTLLR